ncbi:MAG: Sulfate adenylyltransferase subunit 1 [Candidatus Anoxychlamydiales bacterium]|nr:Sulfate adenylyltransferase subunit 1 [Candidatus Anoxychlamydiales bacterium]
MSDNLNIVIVGHVDHGKSTILGRLLYDTQALPQGKLENIKKRCEINKKVFEYAFLLDALKEEQSQGITIDTARCFFKHKEKNFMFLDAPGHVEFIKNMVTGSSQADAAFLVIDAKEGIKENSIRHGYLLSMLNIKQVVVIINKIDLIDYNYKEIKTLISNTKKFLNKLDIKPKEFIPLSGIKGDNIVSLSLKTPWYKKSSLLEVLYKFQKIKPDVHKPFRMSIQDVYKFTSTEDKRIIVGTIQSGKICVGDELIVYPTKNISKVITIERFNSKNNLNAEAGESIGITLDKPIYITRGNIFAKKNEEKIEVSNRVEVKLFWMGKEPLRTNKKYIIKIGSDKTSAEIEEIKNVIDISTLKHEKASLVENNNVANCILKLNKNIAFDILMKTAQFVIIDNYQIMGGGVITKNANNLQQEDSLVNINSLTFKDLNPCIILLRDNDDKFLKRISNLMIDYFKGKNISIEIKNLEKKNAYMIILLDSTNDFQEVNYEFYQFNLNEYHSNNMKDNFDKIFKRIIYDIYKKSK